MRYRTRVATIAGKSFATVRVADNPLTRLIGLLRTPELPTGEGLLIKPCNAVHTLGMGYAIDVLFLTRDGTILKVVSQLPPGRLGAMAKGAHQVIELPAGSAEREGLRQGDRVTFLEG